MIETVDIIYGLAWGDEGKGKISNAIAKDYDMVCRWNGGPNAGHTVWINNVKYKTHIIPCGIFEDKPSIIGPGCVLHVDKFYKELSYLHQNGFNIDLVKVSPRAHIITDDHIEYDLNNLKGKLGTTGQGIAPCYADKMLRKGKRAEDVFSRNFLWDEKLKGRILCEGAQSVWLDIDHGDYPYVTSSTTMPYGACSLGFSPKKIGKLIGVAKIYDTKSGVDPLFPEMLWEDKILNQIIQEGQEFGSTTGRKRLVNWLNLDKLIAAINLSGCTDLYVNKCDVLKTVGEYRLKFEGQMVNFQDIQTMQDFIKYYIKEQTDVKVVNFSGSKEHAHI